jgi:guanylate cyclase
MHRAIDQDKIIREKSFLLMVPLWALAALVWACLYYYYGAKRAAIIPGSYSLISFVSLLIFRWQRSFNLFRTTQLTLILLLPCLLHLSLGNFVSSSAIIIWAILCPLSALAFHNTRSAVYWLLLFIACMIIVFYTENKVLINETRLPDDLISILFALNISFVTILLFYLLRYFVAQNNLVKEKLKAEQAMLANEREKSEKLLLNILPAPIAARLKEGQHVIADEYAEATVLFADIVEFTNISQNISPAILVENLNKIFKHFDDLVDRYGTEKIKTIGDAYMVVSGLNRGGPHEKRKMADLALSMMKDIQQYTLDGHTKCNLRIGIHIGSVTAGVIGSKKFSYDVWGDAVNTASRMESSGEPGKIQVSEEFYKHIMDDYQCEPRGQIEIKGKGLMNLYFLIKKKNSPIKPLAGAASELS